MKELKIYFTSDIHGYIYPTTYADREERDMGLLKCGGHFQKDGNTLIIDGGDMLQGSAFAAYSRKELKSNQPIAKLMNLCGYDYITLGNHDFNYGQEYLREYIKDITAKCVCQNIIEEGGEVLYPYDIKTMANGLRVGIAGIVTDYVNVWEKQENLKGIRITEPLEKAREALTQMKDKVDLTVCIYHGGFEKEPATGRILSESSENIAYRICEELDYDILLTGHQHMSIEGVRVHKTYVVQPKEYGREYHFIHVSMADKALNIYSECRKANGEYNLSLYREFYKLESKVQGWLDMAVGELQEELLPKSKIHMAMKGSKIAAFLNQIQLHYSGAQLSAVSLPNEVAGFRKRVTRRDVLATYPYPNTLVVLEINGKDLKEAIERSAQYFKVGGEGDIGVADSFLEPKIEHYNYDYFAGITYKIDVTREHGKRVVELKYEDAEIQEEDKFTICINSYRASGAGDYPMYRNCKVVKEIDTDMAELILSYFEEKTGEVITVKEPEEICIKRREGKELD